MRGFNQNSELNTIASDLNMLVQTQLNLLQWNLKEIDLHTLV